MGEASFLVSKESAGAENMKTFILLTFGFLGFAFYELSGGSDFQPASARLAAEAPQAAAAPEEVVATSNVSPDTPAATATASITKIDNSPSVTRVSLNLTNISEAAKEAAATTTATVLNSAETPQIILPSLIATTQTADTATIDAVSSDGDIRTVSASRVNVRGGPSTQHGIVNKLKRGQSVQILEDNGNGWVRMQPVDGSEAGWMADFLLTSG